MTTNDYNLRLAAEWKGFELGELREFGIRCIDGGVEVPYFTRRGKHWRSKLFRPDGSQRFLGESKALIPYGLETLRLGGDVVILTEGESDALALRLAWPNLPVLGIPGASAWKAEWTATVDDFLAVYLSFDADQAGERLVESVRVSLPGARAIRLPAGADTRDVLQRLGRHAYKRLVDEARANAEVRAAWRSLDLAVAARRRVDEEWAEAA